MVKVILQQPVVKNLSIGSALANGQYFKVTWREKTVDQTESNLIEDSENDVNEQHIMSFTTVFKSWGKIRKAGPANGHEIEQQIQIFPNGYIKVLTLTR